ncbi:MAG TPA: DUF6166 domain-containing protein [Verrucomicrobiae bacterium]|nr:DUF6166 domain-containing protein [Verrucomicrobiae bacterium]
MKHYEGRRRFGATRVTVDGWKLKARLDLRSHSPAEFEWGYGGSGPAQLALAILADHLQDDQEALNLYQRFKWNVIAGLPRHYWKLSSRDIDRALQEIRNKEPLEVAI